MSTLSPDEVKNELISELGNEFGSLLNLLDHRATMLEANWQIYRSLFGAFPERYEFLFQTGGLAIRLIEENLWEKVQLLISRLTDPASQRKNRNLSLRQLITHMDTPERNDAMTKKIENIEKLAVQVRKERRKRIAHDDLRVAKAADRLEGSSRAEIQELVDAISDAINFCHVEFLDEDLCHRPIGASNSAIELLNSLWRGNQIAMNQFPSEVRPIWLNFSDWDR